MKKRWWIYLVVGVLFGIFDFYYQELTQGIRVPLVVWMVITLGIWLPPIVPVVIWETLATRSRWKAALAGIWTWSTAVIAYYLFLVVKLMLIGEPSRPELHITNSADPYYWVNVKNLLLGDVPAGIGEWIGVAVVGGAVVGLIVSSLTLRIHKPRLPATAA